MTQTTARERVAGDQLSRAASAIWRHRTADPDPYDAMGYGADCGDLIDAHHRAVDLAAVTEAGYATPGAYNEDLRSRMVGPDGKMSYRVYELLMALEIDQVCPRCGAALDVTTHRTRQYGGGWDTYERCPSCCYAEVYV